MNLEGYYFVSQIVAAAAVVGSLIFVGLQMRRQAIETRIATNTRLLEEYRQFAMTSALDPDIVDAYEKSFAGGFAAIRRKDRQRYAVMVSSSLRMLEQAFFLHQAGRLETVAFNSMELALTPMALSRAGREYWKVRRNAFYGPFQAYMDSIQDRPGLTDHFHEFLEDPVRALARIDAEQEGKPDTDVSNEAGE